MSEVSFEEVQAFVNDFTEYRNLDEQGKLAWNDRAKQAMVRWELPSETALAKALGIPNRTLSDRFRWSEAPGRVRRAGGSREQRAVSEARRLEDAETQEAVVRAIAKKNPAVVSKVHAEQTPVHTPAERKAAEAAAAAITQPLKDASSGFRGSTMAEVIDEITEDLAAMKGSLSKRELAQLRKAGERFIHEIEVQEFAAEMEAVQ